MRGEAPTAALPNARFAQDGRAHALFWVPDSRADAAARPRPRIRRSVGALATDRVVRHASSVDKKRQGVAE